jgi:hypothetical protein
MTTKSDLKAAAKAATEVPLETSRQYAERQLSDGRWAMGEKKRSPELFEAGRRDQIRLGLRHPNVHERNLALKAKWISDAAKEDSLSAAQIAATTAYPEPVCREMTAAQVLDLKKTDSSKYDQYRLAAATFKILPESLLEKLNVADVVSPDEVLQPIPAAVAAALNLDPSLKVSKVGMDRALQEYANKMIAEAANKEDAAAS